MQYSQLWPEIINHNCPRLTVTTQLNIAAESSLSMWLWQITMETVGSQEHHSEAKLAHFYSLLIIS